VSAPRPPIYGLLAEFHTPGELVAAARKTTEAGYRAIDAYSPFPIEALSEALELSPSRLPLLVLVGGILGLLTGFTLQYWSATIAYPFNIGGRPDFSWPAFIPPTFETTILFAAGTAVFGMLALNGLPQPYHPVFNVPSFVLASRDRFFLCIEAKDPKFESVATRSFLQGLGASEVSEVEH
jgi:hypothetical protein